MNGEQSSPNNNSAGNEDLTLYAIWKELPSTTTDPGTTNPRTTMNPGTTTNPGTDKPSNVNFTDVPSWFTTEVGWAAANDITEGYGDGTFGTGDSCTNPQILTFLWRAAGKPATRVKSPFTV